MYKYYFPALCPHCGPRHCTSLHYLYQFVKIGHEMTLNQI